jgi:hypothetical protein
MSDVAGIIKGYEKTSLFGIKNGNNQQLTTSLERFMVSPFDRLVRFVADTFQQGLTA